MTPEEAVRYLEEKFGRAKEAAVCPQVLQPLLGSRPLRKDRRTIAKRYMVVSMLLFGMLSFHLAGALIGAEENERPAAKKAAPVFPELKPNAWHEVPNSNLNAVAPNPPVLGYVTAVIKAWSGGAFDTKRDRLIVWGGGHGDYSGNEIYAFDLNTLRWSRVTDPSPQWPGDPSNLAFKTQHPDGSPISRHTYNYLAYLPPPTDRFFCGGGNSIWSNGQFGDKNTYFFDFDTKKWTVTGAAGVPFGYACCAVDAHGKVWQITQEHRNLCSFDPKANTWSKHADWMGSPLFNGWIGYSYTSEIDTKRNRFLMVGKGQTVAFDLNNPNANPVRLPTTGAKEAESWGETGLACHKPSDRLVAYKIGGDVHSLDLETNVWTRQVPTGPAPKTAKTAGTYGRFRWSPAKDVFVVVHALNENVFLYRLPPK